MALTQTQVSQLYVAIFNRASEGSGNAFWQAQPDMGAAATAMLDTTDAQTYFGTSLDSNQAFIEHIYLNTLNKTVNVDPEGIAYWVGLLENGVSRGEVVAGLVQAIESYSPNGVNYDPEDDDTVAAYNQFANRVAVSNYMADTLVNPPADYAQSTVFDKDLVVTDDPDTLVSAKQAVDILVAAEKGEDPGDPGDPDPGDPIPVEIDAGTSNTVPDASGNDYVFLVSSGTYTQTIQNFGTGDVLDFPEGNFPAVDNEDFSDGMVDIDFAVSQQVTTIRLTGLDPAIDAQLLGVPSFETVFGEGTII